MHPGVFCNSNLVHRQENFTSLVKDTGNYFKRRRYYPGHYENGANTLSTRGYHACCWTISWAADTSLWGPLCQQVCPAGVHSCGEGLRSATLCPDKRLATLLGFLQHRRAATHLHTVDISRLSPAHSPCPHWPRRHSCLLPHVVLSALALTEHMGPCL